MAISKTQKWIGAALGVAGLATAVLLTPRTPVNFTYSPAQCYFPQGNPLWKDNDTINITKGTSDVLVFGKTHNVVIRILDTVNIAYTGGSSGQVRFLNDCYGITLLSDTIRKPLRCASFIMHDLHDCTFGGVEVVGGLQVGVFFGDEPDSTDRMTYYIPGATDNYTYSNVTLHNFDVHDTQHEGVYCGSSSPNGNTFGGKFMIPARGVNFHIRKFKVWNTGWTGMQLNNWREGFDAHDITIYNFGMLDTDGHKTGFAMGANNKGVCYNITVKKGTGNGIQLYGYDSVYLHDFSIDSVGNHFVNGVYTPEQSLLTKDAFSTVETNPKQTLIIYNGTISHPVSKAIVNYVENNNALPGNYDKINFIIPNGQPTWQATYLDLVPNSIKTNLTLNGATDVIIPPPPINDTLVNKTISTTQKISWTNPYGSLIDSTIIQTKQLNGSFADLNLGRLLNAGSITLPIATTTTLRLRRKMKDGTSKYSQEKKISLP